MRSQTNHKTFNGTRDDKLPETADRSDATSGVRKFALPGGQRACFQARVKHSGDRSLSLLGSDFPAPVSKKQKLTQTKQLLALAQIPASDKLDGWECKRAQGTHQQLGGSSSWTM
ncbi:MAG: hypothetical protein ICV52_00795 [Microcoleus sp. C1-bin4]|nr:hypothetical protein [Microcoleus sp. C1-bin4]